VLGGSLRLVTILCANITLSVIVHCLRRSFLKLVTGRVATVYSRLGGNWNRSQNLLILPLTHENNNERSALVVIIIIIIIIIIICGVGLSP
jgi:hypothetical protein